MKSDSKWKILTWFIYFLVVAYAGPLQTKQWRFINPLMPFGSWPRDWKDRTDLSHQKRQSGVCVFDRHGTWPNAGANSWTWWAQYQHAVWLVKHVAQATSIVFFTANLSLTTGNGFGYSSSKLSCALQRNHASIRHNRLKYCGFDFWLWVKLQEIIWYFADPSEMLLFTLISSQPGWWKLCHMLEYLWKRCKTWTSIDLWA